MEEKILQTKKNGMVMLLLTLLGYAVTVLLFFYSIILLDESLFPASCSRSCPSHTGWRASSCSAA